MVADKPPQQLTVGDVHFGGGTPNLIKPVQFVALMEFLRRRFSFLETATIAVEIDPRTFTVELAKALEAVGVNRASLGVQSFDPVVQNAINRVQTEEQIALAVEKLRGHAVNGINFDLIYGLPDQTVESCVKTASVAAAMRPGRLAVVGYAHVPFLRKNQRMIRVERLPDNSARAEQAVAIGRDSSCGGISTDRA